jgi:hypothetical protein
MERSFGLWRAIPAFVGVYHLLVGLLLMFSGEAAIKAAKVFGGMTIVGSPEMGILGEILACYILAFGAMMLVAAYDPAKNRACLSIGVVLCALRVLQRLLYGAKLMSVFQMDAAHYWSSLAVVTFLGIGLALFRWRLFQAIHGGAASH